MQKKHVLFVFALITTITSQAQTLVEVNSLPTALEAHDSVVYVSPEDSIYNKAEADYQLFFKMHADPAVSRDTVYSCLMESFANFNKSLEWSTDSVKAIIKERIRSIHPYMQEGGFFYYQARRDREAYPFIKQFLCIPEMPMFSGEQFRRDRNYINWVAYAATEALRCEEFDLAAKFFQSYLDSGEKAHQERSYAYLAIALNNLGQTALEERIVEEGLMNYPNNLSLLTSAIDLSLANHQPEKTKEYLAHALTLDPTNVDLIFLKGQMFDEERKYLDALKIYEELQQQYPQDLRIVEKRAYCYYNIGVTFINESNKLSQGEPAAEGQANDPAQIELMRAEGKKNLNQCITLFNTLHAENPNETSYLVILIDAYRNTGNAKEADRLQSQMNNGELRMDEVAEDETKIPNFNEWAAPLVNEDLEKWARKDDFETTAEFKKRVNEKTLLSRKEELYNRLKQEFIATYAHRFDLNDFTLKPYDADHETFKIQTRQGDIYLPVPRANNEAQKFQKMWNSVHAENPKFDIDSEGNMVLSELVFAMANGTNYLYDARKDVSYGQANVTVQFAKVGADDLAQFGGTAQQRREEAVSNIVVGDSDVDREVPKNKRINENTYALIICNEEYERVGNVEFARADGNSFFNYCKNTLGVPGKQIKLLENATMNEMIGEIEELKYFMRSRNGNARVFVYYSGHGLPDPNTGDGYLVPSDAFPTSLRTCYKLSEMYAGLSEVPSQSVTVFLDACFSGSNRSGEHIDKAARGVAIRSKATTPKGKMVVFSACSGEETAYPLAKQKHGLFTYHLLKKLQESKGHATYGEIAEYIKKNVSQQSIDINKKPQTPTVRTSVEIPDGWERWRMDREEN